MKILYWNLFNNENSKYVISLIKHYDIDIAIFAEHKALNSDSVIHQLKTYVFEPGFGGNDRIVVFYRENVKLEVRQEQSRYTLYTANYNKVPFNIIGVHLEPNLHYSDHARLQTLTELANDIKNHEKKTGSEKTIVIGDFNTNPFAPEMVNKKALNGVLFKDLILSRQSDTYERKTYKRFYNPMMMHLSESRNEYGSYYYTSGLEVLHWYAFDQILVRSELVSALKKIEYCNNTGEYKLVSKNGIPDKSVSDHLPLYVEVLI